MKKYFLFSSFFFLLVISFGFFLYLKVNESGLISPVLGISKTMLASNVWFPKESSGSAFLQAPEITAEAAFFIDTQTGDVLYEKNAHERLPIASLAKIMTVIVTLEHRSPEDIVEVSSQASEMEPDKMFLKPHEKLTIHELMQGIFLVSANDAAETLAETVTGNRADFIQLMNEKSMQLGLKNTSYINPSGLEEDDGAKLSYSSAYDLAVMSRYAITKWPFLVDISSQPHIYIPETSDHQSYDLYSGINLLTTYPGVVGFKTGYTPQAGLTLVTLARRNGKEVMGVLLNSTSRREDAKVMLDYSYRKLGIH